MTDEQQWLPPGATPPAGPPATPPAAPSPPPVVGPASASPPPFPPPASPYGAPFGGPSGAPFGGPPPGWTPPPKPGLIPLRPLDLGTILGAAFRVLRRNPKPTFGAALLIQGSTYLLLLLAVGFVTFFAASRVESATSENADQIQAGSVGLIVLAALVPGLLSVVASALLQGIIVLEVARGTVGEKLRFRQLWVRARGRIGALIGWAFLLILGSLVAVGALTLLIVLLVLLLGQAGIVLGVLLGLLGLLGLGVLYAWLGTRFALVPSALMIERLSLRAAVIRSWSLSVGFFWRTFGIILLVAVILGVVTQVISTPLSFLAPMLTSLADPQGQNQAGTITIVAIITVLALMITVAFQAITSVVQSAVTALLYIDLRIRKEGLDLELAHFVEARQGGDDTVPDPYLTGVQGPNGYYVASSTPTSDGSPWG